MKLSGIVRNSVVDGTGLRDVIFFQGCSIRCPGCHNSDTHDPNLGEDITPEELLERMSGRFNNCITLSGGEPLEQNLDELYHFIKLFKNRCKEYGLKPNIWIYSGRRYSYNTITEDKDKLKVLKQCNILVDGPFVLDKKKELLFRGSENQRIIDLKKTLSSKSISIARNI